MAIQAKPGQSLRVTVKKTITRDGARKTLRRLFMEDRAISDPIDARSRNFIELPKRRGGCIWTKRPNKVHAPVVTGTTATLRVTAQILRDLASLQDFVDVTVA